MRDDSTTNERLIALERAVAEIRQLLTKPSPTGNWVEQLFGPVADEEGMAKAFEDGQVWRKGQQLPDTDEESP